MWQGAPVAAARCSRRKPKVVGMEEYLDVKDLWRAGKTLSEIARVTGRDRKTVRRLVRDQAPGPRAPRVVSSKLDPFRDYLLQRLLQRQGDQRRRALRRDPRPGLRGWPQHPLGVLASAALAA